MQNLLNDLQQLLQTDERLVTEGRLVKNKIIELALQTNADLLKMLLKNDTIKAHFFTDVDGILVFDKIKFMRFVANKQFLPDSYTAYKNKVGLIKEGDYYDDYLTKRNDVVLAWPYKDTVLQGGQTKEDDKRNEVFWNETLAPDQIDRLLYPKVLTNWKKYSTDGMHSVSPDEPINFNKENLIIKGNNLLALHSLKQRYAGKVKLIYIDPPYNTGNDSFMYNDSFNHSTWLSFMKNRLVIAREFLRNDGVIFIHLDDIEEAYLKILCDEIFGRENFVNVIAVRSSTPSGTKTAHKDKSIIKQKDLILVYKKGSKIQLKPQYFKRESWDSHYSLLLQKDGENYRLSSLKEELVRLELLDSKQKLSEINIDNAEFKKYYLSKADSICRLQSHKNKTAELKSREIINEVYVDLDENGNKRGLYYNGQVITPLKQGLKEVYYQQQITEDLGMLLCDFWHDIDFQNTQNEGSVSLSNGKKPELLLYRIIDMTTSENDIVMDFFAGSGTTAAIAHKMKRRYIAIEQLDYIEDLPLERLQNVIGKMSKPDGELHEKLKYDQSGISKAVNWQGGGNFVYCELLQYNQKYIDKIMQAESTETLLTIWEDMRENAFLNYLFNNKSFDKNIEYFKQLELAEQKKFLFELLDKNQLYLNYGEIEDENFAISETDKKLNNQFYKTR